MVMAVTMPVIIVLVVAYFLDDRGLGGARCTTATEALDFGAPSSAHRS
jgi:hypothetical protein